ncbi:MAG: type IV pilus modification PilV family protein [Verrucomicrobiales bacterium]
MMMTPINGGKRLDMITKGTNFRQKSRAAGFTMIEIAICIAVVSFALVAIIGILPTGMTVQRDNREDTVLNQEGAYWLEAIKGGSRGLDDLTNYVEAITISNRLATIEIQNTPTTPFTGEMIIGLLSTPKTEIIGGQFVTNRVTARVKAMTGAAGEKGSITNENSFRYELQSEVIPYLPPFVSTNDIIPSLRHQNLAYNLHDVRLVLRWPLFERGDTWVAGSSRKYFRTSVAGGLTTHSNIVPGALAYFLRQNSFTNATPVL